MSAYLALVPNLIVWIEADPDTFDLPKKAIWAAPPGSVHQICLNALVGESDGTTFHRFSDLGESTSIFAATPLLQDAWPHVVETGEALKLPSRRLASLPICCRD